MLPILSEYRLTKTRLRASIADRSCLVEPGALLGVWHVVRPASGASATARRVLHEAADSGPPAAGGPGASRWSPQLPPPVEQLGAACFSRAIRETSTPARTRRRGSWSRLSLAVPTHPEKEVGHTRTPRGQADPSPRPCALLLGLVPPPPPPPVELQERSSCLGAEGRRKALSANRRRISSGGLAGGWSGRWRKNRPVALGSSARAVVGPSNVMLRTVNAACTSPMAGRG